VPEGAGEFPSSATVAFLSIILLSRYACVEDSMENSNDAFSMDLQTPDHKFFLPSFVSHSAENIRKSGTFGAPDVQLVSSAN